MLKLTPPIIVIDRDEGINSEVTIVCFNGMTSEDSYSNCDTFDVRTERISDGNYTAQISIKKLLDFETRPSYVLTLLARDGAHTNQLSTQASVSINVIDVQDQVPVFVNAPYSATLEENTPQGTSVLSISAMDGDTQNPRPVLLSIENDNKNHFRLVQQIDGKAVLETTDIPLDLEDSTISQNGGVYSFNIRAREMINNEVPGDSTTTQVTIVLTDKDDNIPEFNAPEYSITIPENLEYDTPLPGLEIVVTDRDSIANSKYNLSLRNIQNSENTFMISPTYGVGRTPLVVKVRDSSKLDYDVADENEKKFVFDIVASVHGQEMAFSRITVQLEDVNDNAPKFSAQSFNIEVKENVEEGTQIADIKAIDNDSGKFKIITYFLKGFGSENFYTDRNTGGVYLKRKLDYEAQKSYSMALVAVDGGGKESNANLFVNIIDVNDNHPMFESLEYTRTIREGATVFEPQFFVRAFDVDGISQGGGRIMYSIDSENSISGHEFTINSETGEIRILKRVTSMDTERGQYELIVSAKDYGVPPLTNNTRVIIRVGISGNQRPIFKNTHNYKNKELPGPYTYRVSIPENAQAGYNVTQVIATDPDGIDALLEYRIVGSNDNFVINETSGLIKVSTDAHLDRDLYPDNYIIVVNAVDAGFPIPETATGTVSVTIKDVNDKAPTFIESSYSAYISERAGLGSTVLTVHAVDPDLNNNLNYSIIEPITATSKSGIQFNNTSVFDYKDAFRINPKTGEITVNKPLKHNLVTTVMITVKAQDLNAEYNNETQMATADVTFYIQSFKEIDPVFKNKGWTSERSEISKFIKEEVPIGSTLLRLEAEDPITLLPIRFFRLLERDAMNLFEVREGTGEIILTQRLDYESLKTPYLNLTVQALNLENNRHSSAFINFTIENVNDNDPVFSSKIYKATILENGKFPEKIATVLAHDNDAVWTELDKSLGYNQITYSIFGQHSKNFLINSTTGEIVIAPNQTVDREKQSVLKFSVQAEDATDHPTESRRTVSEIVIEVLDVNDNSPHFRLNSYSAVIPENIPLNTFVINVTATDPDEGPGGEIFYDFFNEGEASGLLKIDRTTGTVTSKVLLTGKGRSEPYELVVRAQDNGANIPKQESFYSDVSFTLYIGDISSNDGVPFFISPKIGQIANVTENASPGSPVFQVIASDPDNPTTLSGMLHYRIQNDTEDANAFKIGEQSGLITTRFAIDREIKSMYNIIIEASDRGVPHQAVSRVLQINVLDIDDHEPLFIRHEDDPPVEISVLEEQVAGTIIGNVTAVDVDIEDNGAIDYLIIEGNQENLFKITRTSSSSGMLSTNGKLDRELQESYLLTIKCFRYKSLTNKIVNAFYNPKDLSEIQVLIKIIDIDDHLPEFKPENMELGIRHNVPADTLITTVQAIDVDPAAYPIHYSVSNISYVPQFYKRSVQPIRLTGLFTLHNRTGELKTLNLLSDYVDGYFLFKIRANNSDKMNRFRETTLKLFIIRDKSLLRFTFPKPPTEVRTFVDNFSSDLQKKLQPSALELHIFEPEVLLKQDHSLDFSSTSICFQLSRHGSALPPHRMDNILNEPSLLNQLTEVYVNYSVNSIESCSIHKKTVTASLMGSTGTYLVVLAGLIGIVALVATCTSCCLFKK